MRYRTAINTRLLVALVILAGVLYSCAPASLFETLPQLGDTRQRQKDGMTMVFVPLGEFTMGIDYLGLRYALELCKKSGMGPAVCKGETFADEMPAHPK